MPRIWSDTIDSHRRQVNDAVLDATAELIAEHGPMSVPMSAIAERAGIGRATLYKYFPDIESILLAWHQRDFADHLQRLKVLTDSDSVTLDDVAAFVCSQRHHHRRHHPATRVDAVGVLAQTVADLGTIDGAVRDEIIGGLASLLDGLARRHEVRTDYAPGTLAHWLFHAIHAPSDIDDDTVAQLLIDSIVAAPTSAAGTTSPTRHRPPHPGL